MAVAVHPESFVVGSAVVRRDIWFGKTWTAWPARVIADDGETLTTAMWPGLVGYGPSTWVESMKTRNAALRGQGIDNLAKSSWNLAAWTWRSNICLRQVVVDRWFAVTAFFDADTERFGCWYIDFGRPPTRTALGIDTLDLFLDVVVNPDFSIVWKDQDEYGRAVRLGLLTSDERQSVEDAKQEVVQLVGVRALLRGACEDWRLDRSWVLPALPREVLREVETLRGADDEDVRRGRGA